jgi:hypothetical protein
MEELRDNCNKDKVVDSALPRDSELDIKLIGVITSI